MHTHSHIPLVCMGQVSKVVTQCLDHHRKADCKYGRITCSEDFKYLARKVYNNTTCYCLVLCFPTIPRPPFSLVLFPVFFFSPAQGYLIINPRRACARVTVVALCVYLSVCYRSSCFSVRLKMEPTILTGLFYAFLGFRFVDFRNNLPFKSYSVKKPICK